MITNLAVDSALRNKHYFLPSIGVLGKNSACKSCGLDFHHKRHVAPPTAYTEALEELITMGSAKVRPMDLLAKVDTLTAKADNIIRSLVASGILDRLGPPGAGGSGPAYYAPTPWGWLYLDMRRSRRGLGPLARPSP